MLRLRANARPLTALALEIGGVALAVAAVAAWSVPLALLLLGVCLVLAALAVERGSVL